MLFSKQNLLTVIMFHRLGMILLIRLMIDGKLKIMMQAFRIDNSVGSLIATAPFNQFEDVDGYNPFEDELTLGYAKTMPMPLFIQILLKKRRNKTTY